MRETYDAISKVSLPCEKDTAQVVEAWGKGGYSVSCRTGAVNHGQWQAWEDAHLVVSGNYINASEDGQWHWYYPDGKLYGTVAYENGKEISNVIQ